MNKYYLILAIVLMAMSPLAADARRTGSCDFWETPPKPNIWEILLQKEKRLSRSSIYSLINFVSQLKEGRAHLPYHSQNFETAWRILKGLGSSLTIQSNIHANHCEGKVALVEEKFFAADDDIHIVSVGIADSQTGSFKNQLSFEFRDSCAEGPCNYPSQRKPRPSVLVHLNQPLSTSIKNDLASDSKIFRFVKLHQNQKAVEMVDALFNKGSAVHEATSPRDSLSTVLNWMTGLGVPMQIQQGEQALSGAFIALEVLNMHSGLAQLRFRTAFDKAMCNDIAAYYTEPPCYQLESKTDLELKRKCDQFKMLQKICTKVIQVYLGQETHLRLL